MSSHAEIGDTAVHVHRELQNRPVRTHDDTSHDPSRVDPPEPVPERREDTATPTCSSYHQPMVVGVVHVIPSPCIHDSSCESSIAHTLDGHATAGRHDSRPPLQLSKPLSPPPRSHRLTPTLYPLGSSQWLVSSSSLACLERGRHPDTDGHGTWVLHPLLHLIRHIRAAAKRRRDLLGGGGSGGGGGGGGRKALSRG
jgi:hypothetical protein